MTVSPGDLHDFCIYAGRFRATFPILDADGDLVTGAAGLDSERSIDCGTYADCTNESTEIATTSGTYYLDLITFETTGSNVSLIVKTSTSGAKTTFLSIPIVRLPILESGTAQAGAASTITLASTASAKDNFYAGLYVQNSNNVPSNAQGQTRKIISYVGSTKVATVEAAWGTNPSSSTTYDILIPLTVNLAAVLCQRMPDWGTAGVPKVDTAYLAGTAQTGRDIGASVLLSTGTGTGQLDFTSGVVKSSLVQILGNAISGTAAQISAAFTKFFDKATPTGTINSLPDAVAGAANGVFIAGTNAATTITTGLTTTFTGNLTGSVGTVNALANNSVTAAAVAADAITSLRSLASGTADSGTTGNMVDAARTEADNDWWKGSFIVFTSGNIAGQVRLINQFVASTHTIGFTPPTTQAVSTQTYEIWGQSRVDLGLIAGSNVSTSTAQLGVNLVNVAGSAVSTTTAQIGTNVVSTSTDAITSSSLAAGCITSSEAPNLDAAVSSRLAPTVAARTLDVSSTGEAGVDWANIGSPTTTVALTGTSIGSGPGTGASTSDVTTARDAILAKLPTALVSGRIDSSVGAMAANTLTASALATDAVTEITSAISAGAATPTNVTDARDAVLAKLPSALVSGRIDASIGAAAANTLTASALATDAVTEIVNAIYAVAGADPATIPAATATAFSKIDMLFAQLVNKKDMNRSTGAVNLYASAAPQTTVIGTRTVTDDGTIETVSKVT